MYIRYGNRRKNINGLKKMKKEKESKILPSYIYKARLWCSRTWVNIITSEELTIESDNKLECQKLFHSSNNPSDWREKK